MNLSLSGGIVTFRQTPVRHLTGFRQYSTRCTPLLCCGCNRLGRPARGIRHTPAVLTVLILPVGGNHTLEAQTRLVDTATFTVVPGQRL